LTMELQALHDALLAVALVMSIVIVLVTLFG
jgi:hypothetical protein